MWWVHFRPVLPLIFLAILSLLGGCSPSDDADDDTLTPPDDDDDSAPLDDDDNNDDSSAGDDDDDDNDNNDNDDNDDDDDNDDTAPPFIEQVAGGAAGYSKSSAVFGPDGKVYVATVKGRMLTIYTADGKSVSETPLYLFGFRPDLAIDSAGRLHVAFFDGRREDLCYATNSGGSWKIRRIDTMGNVGRAPSIALGGDGSVHISYGIDEIADKDSYAYLRYATNAGGSWTTTTLEYEFNNRAYTSSLAVDAAGKVHIAHTVFYGGDVYYTTNKFGSWTSRALAYGYQSECALALDHDGRVHITFNDDEDLYYATNAGGSWWGDFAVEQAGIVGASWGSSHDFALDADGRPCILYVGPSDWMQITRRDGAAWSSGELGVQGINPSLTFAADGTARVSFFGHYPYYRLFLAAEGSDAWSFQTLEPVSDFGEGLDLALDATGAAHLSYRENDNGRVLYSTNGSGSWQTQVVADIGDLEDRGATGLALDADGAVHIVYGNGANLSLDHAVSTAKGWSLETVAEGEVWDADLAIDAAGRLHAVFGGPTIRYAILDDGMWTVSEIEPEPVGSLSLTLDSDGAPHVAYAKTDWVSYAFLSAESWVHESVLSETYAQSLSLGLDDGRIAYLTHVRTDHPWYTNDFFMFSTNESGYWQSDYTQTASNDTALAISPAGDVHALIYTYGYLDYAIPREVWQVVPLDHWSDGLFYGVGSNPVIVLDGENLHAVYRANEAVVYSVFPAYFEPPR